MPVGRFLALTLLAVAGITAAIVWVFPPTEDFRPENPFWNGLQGLAAGQEMAPLASFEDLPADPLDTALVVVPQRPPSEEAVARVRGYVEAGGLLVLADDYGFGNAFLEGLGVGYRFSGALLLDPLFNYRNRRLPVVTDIAISPYTEGVSSLALNFATALEGEDLTPVARSSAFSFLDIARNGEPDPEEPLGPLPVVAHGAVGAGRLVVVSDSSIFINSMLEMEDNARFVSNVLGGAGPDSRIFLDQSLLPASTLTAAKGRLAAVRAAAGSPAATAGLTIALSAALLYPVWRKPRKEQAVEPD